MRVLPFRAPAGALVLLLAASCLAPARDDPALSDRVEAADGVPIAVGVGGTGAPTLVLVHGWSCDHAFWGALPARLAADHQVVLLDLPGHGASGAGRDTWSIDALGRDVVSVCDALHLDDVVLVGHSMGAAVSLSAAARMRGRVRGVIALDGLHDLSARPTAEQMEPLARAFEKDWHAAMRSVVGGVVPAGAGSDLARWIVAHADRSDHAACIALLRSYDGLDFEALAKAAAVPIRAINAAPYANGPVTNVEGNRAICDYDAVLVPDVGHFLQLEKPEVVEADLRAFLKDLAPPAAG